MILEETITLNAGIGGNRPDISDRVDSRQPGANRNGQSVGGIGNELAQEVGSESNQAKAKREKQTSPDQVLAVSSGLVPDVLGSHRDTVLDITDNHRPAKVIPFRSKPRIELTGWKKNGTGKPPTPDGFELSTKHGARQIGRRTYHGFQILQVAKCGACEKRVRPVAAYIGAIALHQLLGESYELQKQIIALKLRRFLEKRTAARCRGCAGQSVGNNLLSARSTG